MLTKQHPTYEGFVEFCKAQPAERKIDHSGGWSDCAVGDYFKEVLGKDQVDYGWARDNIPLEIYDRLSNKEPASQYPTYGDLVPFLESYL